jgi:hypothetical protein
MRFLILVAAAGVTGAVAVASLKSFFPQHDAMLMTSVRAAAAGVAQLRLSDLNPVQRAYDYVAGEISSPRPNAAFNLQSAPVVVGEIKVPQLIEIKPLDLNGGFAPRNALPSHRAPGR